ncbi:MAG TPA: formate dehydrogenase accessory sulfurtransferase FdhD [Vicinamibacterales bacterium]|nr:formate dehydrogenase accessory sulfurtransferase FdhD [Vicinamibacterales bacterium]
MTTVLRVDGGSVARLEDAVAVEEPLEIRLNGFSFAVLMRTPGDDEALAAGFLFAERVIAAARDIERLEPCTDADHPHARNVVNVTLGGEAAARLERTLTERRCVVTNSSCGVCGRLSIESLQVHAPFIDGAFSVSADVVRALPETLRRQQSLFNTTGGLHGAGLFRRDGACVSAFEDVGRHNAVDKLVGSALLSGSLPASDLMLAVSGRASFELVQKAFLAGIPLLAAVSAPSSLAIQLAEAAGITLIGFVRQGSFNMYTHERRVSGDRQLIIG